MYSLKEQKQHAATLGKLRWCLEALEVQGRPHSSLIYAADKAAWLGKRALEHFGTLPHSKDAWRAFTEQEPGIWKSAVIVLGWVLRDYVQLIESSGGNVEAESQLGSVSQVITLLLDVIKLPGSRLGRTVARALIASDTLACASQIIAAWQQAPAFHVLRGGLLVELASICNLSEAALAPGRRHTALYDIPLYCQWVEALARSSLLEHLARAYTQVLADARSAGPVARHDLSFYFLCGDTIKELALAVIATQSELGAGWESICPRPISTSRGPSSAAQARLIALLPTVRQVLSGPCVQYVLGRDLVEATLRATGWVGPRHGLPVPPGGVDEEAREGQQLQRMAGGRSDTQNLLARMACAVGIWQITVSGPLPPRVVQPPLGWLPSASGVAATTAAPAAAAAAGADGGGEPPLRPPPGMPYAAVNVYDMTCGALVCVMETVPPDDAKVLRVVVAAHMLARIVIELRPRHATARLPGLWRVLCGALATADGTGLQFVTGFVQSLGCLLRADVGEPGTLAAAPMAAAAVEVAAVLPLGGVQGAATGGLPAAVATPHAGPSFSLGCALHGGLLHSLERLLRRAAAPQLPVERQFYFLCINALLRYSGVWPAGVLAHGSVRQVASLTITLRKLVPALRGVPQENVLSAGEVPSGVLEYPASTGRDGELCLYLIALMEQTAAVLLVAPPPSPQASEPGGAQPGSCVRSPLWRAGLESLPFNAALEPDSPQMQLAWVERAGGGRPTHRSAAAQQQRLLAVFAAMQWLPVLLSFLPSWRCGKQLSGIHPFGQTVSQSLLLMALQCLAAARRQADAGGSASASAGSSSTTASASNNVAGSPADSGTSSSSSAAAFAAWQDWLLYDLDALHWIAHVLLDIGDVCTSFCRSGRVVMNFLPSVLLDALEALVAAAPQGVLRRAAVGRAAAAGETGEARVATVAGAGSGAAHAHRSSSSSCSGDRGSSLGASDRSALVVLDTEGPLAELLQQDGRHALLAALRELSHGPPTAGASRLGSSSGSGGGACGGQGEGGGMGSSRGSGGGSGGDTAPREVLGLPSLRHKAAPCRPQRLQRPQQSAVEALVAHVVSKHALEELPLLPSPEEALAAVAAVGVRPCCNGACANLEGPSEALLQPKRCGRCRAVYYCSGGCQQAHWRAGHKDECPKLAAALLRASQQSPRRE